MTPLLPPLANVIAMYSRDPDRLARFAARIGADATLKIFRPASNWVAAFHTLPLSAPDSEAVLQQGYVFAEGREDVAARADPIPGLRRLGAALDHPEPRQLARIPGDFTFFRFKKDGSVTAVRSCGGLVPVYIWESSDGLVLSTHATWLAKYASWRGQPDWLITAMWLSGWPTFARNRSHLEGVKILHKGERFDARPSPVMPAEAGIQFSFKSETTTLDARRSLPPSSSVGGGHDGESKLPICPSRITRYWYPPQASELRWPTKKIEQEHQQEFRSILIESLRQNLDPAGGNLLSLSGGVDSSSLLALAAGHLQYPVKTFSLTPPKSAKFYEREMGYLNALWTQYRIEHQELEIRSQAELDLSSRLPPLLFPGFNPTTLALIGPLREAGIRVIFGGEFADEVVGSSSFTLPDWSRHVPVWRLPFLLQRLPRSKRLPLYMLEQQITSRLTGRVAAPFPSVLATWLSPNLEPERAAFQAAVEKEWADAGIGSAANPTLWLRMMYMEIQPMYWEICSWLGVRRFSPFSTRPILDLALRCHPTELMGPGSKRLLRRSLKGLVPSQYLDRTDKGSFGLQQPEASRTEAALQALHDAGWQPLLTPGAGQPGVGASAYLVTLAGFYASRYRAFMEAGA